MFDETRKKIAQSQIETELQNAKTEDAINLEKLKIEISSKKISELVEAQTSSELTNTQRSALIAAQKVEILKEGQKQAEQMRRATELQEASNKFLELDNAIRKAGMSNKDMNTDVGLDFTIEKANEILAIRQNNAKNLMLTDTEELAQFVSNQLDQEILSAENSALIASEKAIILSSMGKQGELIAQANELQETSNKVSAMENAIRKASVNRMQLQTSVRAQVGAEQADSIRGTREAAQRALITESPEDALAFAESLKQTNIEIGNGSRAMDQLRVRMAQMRVESENLGSDLVDIGLDEARTGLKNLFMDIGTGAKSASEAFEDFGLTIAKSILDRIMQNNIDKIISDLTFAFTGEDGGMSDADKIAGSNNHLVDHLNKLSSDVLPSLGETVRSIQQDLKEGIKLNTGDLDEKMLKQVGQLQTPLETLGKRIGQLATAIQKDAQSRSVKGSKEGEDDIMKRQPERFDVATLNTKSLVVANQKAPEMGADLKVEELKNIKRESLQSQIKELESKSLSNNVGDGIEADMHFIQRGVDKVKGDRVLDQFYNPENTYGIQDIGELEKNFRIGTGENAGQIEYNTGKSKDDFASMNYDDFMHMSQNMNTADFSRNIGVSENMGGLYQDVFSQANSERQLSLDEESELQTKIAELKEELAKLNESIVQNTTTESGAGKAHPLTKGATSSAKDNAGTGDKVIEVGEAMARQKSATEDLTLAQTQQKETTTNLNQTLLNTDNLMGGFNAKIAEFQATIAGVALMAKTGLDSEIIELIERAKESLRGLIGATDALTGSSYKLIAARKSLIRSIHGQIQATNNLVKTIVDQEIATRSLIDAVYEATKALIEFASAVNKAGDSTQAGRKSAAKDCIKICKEPNEPKNPEEEEEGKQGGEQSGGITGWFKNLFKYNGGKIQKFAQGGLVQGPAGQDRVPAMLTAGEYVIPKDEVSKYNAGGFVSAAGGAAAGGAKAAGAAVLATAVELNNQDSNSRGVKAVQGVTRAVTMYKVAEYMNEALNKKQDKPPTFDKNRLNQLDLKSSVSLAKGDPRLSSKFINEDPVMDEYRQHLMDKAAYTVKKKNQKFQKRKALLSTIVGAYTSFLTANYITPILTQGIQMAKTGAANIIKGSMGFGKYSDSYKQLNKDGAGVDYADIENSFNTGKDLSYTSGTGEARQVTPYGSIDEPGKFFFDDSMKLSDNTQSTYSMKAHQPKFFEELGSRLRKNAGGKIPAMLTAGESVIPAETAKKIGYARLSKINSSGELPIVQGPAGIDKVGPVGLTEGDFVIKKSATDKLVKANSNIMRFSNLSSGNTRQAPKRYYEGGIVGTSGSSSPSTFSGGQSQSSQQGSQTSTAVQPLLESVNSNQKQAVSQSTNNEVTNNINVNVSIDQSGNEQVSSDSGANSVEQEQALAMKIKTKVMEVIREEKRIGGELS